MPRPVAQTPRAPALALAAAIAQLAGCGAGPEVPASPDLVGRDGAATAPVETLLSAPPSMANCSAPQPAAFLAPDPSVGIAGGIFAPSITFDAHTAQMSAEDYGLIDAVAVALQLHPEIVAVDVIGHAPPATPELAMLRAGVVVRRLVEKGIDARRLRPAWVTCAPSAPPSDPSAATDVTPHLSFAIAS